MFYEIFYKKVKEFDSSFFMNGWKIEYKIVSKH